MYEFDKCAIMDRGQNEIANGVVQQYEDDTMKIGITDGGIIHEGTEVSVYIFNSMYGECKFEATVKFSSDVFVTLSNIRFVNSYQKRENVRVDKIMLCKITCKFIKNNDGKEEKRGLDKPIDITILNISATGLYINSAYKFRVGDTFPFTLTNTSKPLDVSVEIVRVEEYGRSNNYGCRFYNISRAEMDIIFKMVLKEQIEQRRRNLLWN